MWRSLLAIYLTDILLGKGKKLLKLGQISGSIIQVQVQEDHYQYGISQLESRQIIIYDPIKLLRIKHVTNHDIRYKQLPFGTVRSIGKFKLNRKKRGSGGGQRMKAYQKITKPTRVTWENLRILPCIPNKQLKHKGN